MSFYDESSYYAARRHMNDPALALIEVREKDGEKRYKVKEILP